MNRALRFSIKHLLVATAVVALFCSALNIASAAWSSAMLGLAILALAAAVLLADYRREAMRAKTSTTIPCGPTPWQLTLAYNLLNPEP